MESWSLVCRILSGTDYKQSMLETWQMFLSLLILGLLFLIYLFYKIVHESYTILFSGDLTHLHAINGVWQ